MNAVKRHIFIVLGLFLGAVGSVWWRDAAVSRYAAAGAALFEVGAYRESLDAYLKALRLKSKDPSILYNVGCVRVQLGDFDHAVQDLETAAQKSQDAPIKANAHKTLGTVWYGEAEKNQSAGMSQSDIEILYSRSVENLRAALRWDPLDMQAASALAMVKRSWKALRFSRAEPKFSAPSEKSTGEAEHERDGGGAGTTDVGGGTSQGGVVKPEESAGNRFDDKASSNSQPRSEETPPRSFVRSSRSSEEALSYHPSLSRTPAEQLGERLDPSSLELVLENILAQEEAQRRSRIPPKSLQVDVLRREW